MAAIGGVAIARSSVRKPRWSSGVLRMAWVELASPITEAIIRCRYVRTRQICWGNLVTSGLLTRYLALGGFRQINEAAPAADTASAGLRRVTRILITAPCGRCLLLEANPAWTASDPASLRTNLGPIQASVKWSHSLIQNLTIGPSFPHQRI